jgi:hypothetical protein
MSGILGGSAQILLAGLSPLKLGATFIYGYGELHGYHFWRCRAQGRRSEQHP